MRVLLRLAPLFLSLCLAPTLCLAQTPGTNDKMLEEMKAVRTSLDRLLQLMEATLKSQNANLTLQQIQMYEKRLEPLETKRDQLAEQEKRLAAEASASAEFLRNPNSVSGPVSAVPSSPESIRGFQDRLAEATRKLDEVRRGRQSADGEISALKARIGDLEKRLDALTR